LKAIGTQPEDLKSLKKMRENSSKRASNMMIKVGRSQLEEAQRLNYSMLLYLIQNTNEIKSSIGSPHSGVLDLTIDAEKLKKRLLDFASNVFINEETPEIKEVALPVLVYDNKADSIIYPFYDIQKEFIAFREYEMPRRTCVVCGILYGSKKEYQEVSLRADYKQKPLDPLSRDQISAVCPFCFYLAKATKSINGVWEIKMGQFELYRSLLTKNLFGNLAFTLKRDLQFVIVPKFSLTTPAFQEAKTFADILNQMILGQDIYTYIKYWCPQGRERDYPHLLMAILDKVPGIFEEIEGFLLFERRRRGRKWSTERISYIKKPILRAIRPYVLHKRKTGLDADTSRYLDRVVRALVDGDLMAYYATLSGELPHKRGSFINSIIDPDKWSSKSCVEDLRKNIIMLG
jgi:hypothetical protein